MKKVVLFLFLVTLTFAKSWFPPTDDTTCGFTRSDALACAIKYGDLNHDGELTQDEIQHALSTLIPWRVTIAAWWKGIDMRRALDDCDYNKDGVLTPRDWELSKDTCMPRQEDLCEFKWFCDQ